MVKMTGEGPDPDSRRRGALPVQGPFDRRRHADGVPMPDQAPPSRDAPTFDPTAPAGRGCSEQEPPSGPDSVHLKARYRQVRWFFVQLIAKSLWWDGFFSLPVLRWVRPPRHRRWHQQARRYKNLAGELGGILIKLGQFISTRVDLFPREVTAELAGLQDSVAPAAFDGIVRVVECEFGSPIHRVYRAFSPAAVGSASLAQAHAAELVTGEAVVVKVLRPGIHRIVETDLKVVGKICKWLKLFRQIRDRMDLDRLLEEFSETTRNELDLLLEAQHIIRFADDFADTPYVCVPRVYEERSGRCVLTLENVAYIKIADTAAMAACGISSADVAERLYDIYMHQIFVTNFVHVDPHPGNLFVKPLPDPEEAEEGIGPFSPGESVPHRPGRPFQIVFIDFGMTASVSERLKAAMRMGAIGLGTQDARKIVQAYILAGSLRPGADIRQLEAAHQEWLQKVWGLRLAKMQETAYRELRYFLREYRDLIMETPFQVQADMLFIGRAVGVLVGLTTLIHPQFDPWSKTLVYAKRFAKEELTEDWQGFWQEVFLLGKNVWRLPSHLEQVLNRANQGAFVVQVSLSPQTRRAITRIDQSVRRFAWMVLTAALLISGVNLHIAGKDRPFGITLVVLSLACFLWGMRKT